MKNKHFINKKQIKKIKKSHSVQSTQYTVFRYTIHTTQYTINSTKYFIKLQGLMYVK